MCGNKESNKQIRPLITIEELKVMKVFEAIVLMPRMMPFKTRLIPDYTIEWNLDKKEATMPKRNVNDLKIYCSNLDK